MRALRALLVLAMAGTTALLAQSAPAPQPAPSPKKSAEPQPAARGPRSERWLHNSGERTSAGRKAWEAGDQPGAAEALEGALELRPDLAETRFNAGTGRLGSGGAGAGELLESAARDASPSLAPAAYYNLGNARMAAGDARGAIAAFRESLLRDPARADAKHNLELALRRLEQQQKQQQQDQQQQQQKKDQQKGGGQQSQPQDDGKQEKKPQSGQDRQPEFRDQPDMNAEQAKALLAAVENLERDQRRKDAQRRAAARAQVEIDW